MKLHNVLARYFLQLLGHAAVLLPFLSLRVLCALLPDHLHGHQLVLLPLAEQHLRPSGYVHHTVGVADANTQHIIAA